MLNWFKRMPMQRKILITYLAVVLLPLTALFGVFVNKTAKDETNRHTMLLQQANTAVTSKLTTIVNDIKSTSAMYIANQDIIGYIENDFNIGKSDYVDALRSLRLNTLSVKVNPYVSSITYFSNSGASYSGAGYNTQYYETLNGFLAEMEKNGQKNMTTPVYDAVINQQSVRTVTYVYSLMSAFSFQNVGHAFINIDLKKLEESFSVLTENGSANTIALQGTEVVFAGSMQSETTKALANAALLHKADIEAGKNVVFKTATPSGEYLCAAAYCEALDWTVISQVPMAAVNTQMYYGVLYYLATVVLMILVFVIVSFVLSLTMTKPLRVLQAGMHEIENGNLVPITEEATRQDDMGTLIKGFNRMVLRLRESLLREYVAKDLQKKAQIKMLQSQINPHFLYNALNVITSIAELRDMPEIGHMATDLADMFRYNIASRSVVDLCEEITQIERYVAIQNMCTAGEIRVESAVSSAALHCKMLKFLLQPLVENCILHGFAGDTKDGEITIKASEEKGILHIEVCDNGHGIEEPNLAKLQAQCACSTGLYTDDEQNEGIGLLNVNYRLKAYYGDNCGLLINSTIGQGTVVAMHIPHEQTIK